MINRNEYKNKVIDLFYNQGRIQINFYLTARLGSAGNIPFPDRFVLKIIIIVLSRQSYVSIKWFFQILWGKSVNYSLLLCIPWNYCDSQNSFNQSPTCTCTCTVYLHGEKGWYQCIRKRYYLETCLFSQLQLLIKLSLFIAGFHFVLLDFSSLVQLSFGF